MAASIHLTRFYLKTGARMMDFGPSPVFQYVNRMLPTHSRILFLNTNRGFFCDRDYIADSCFEASQIQEWLGRRACARDIREALHVRRISHVLWAPNIWGIAYSDSFRQFLQDPQYCEAVFKSADAQTVLFALR